MLVLHRKQGRWEDRLFRDLPQFLQPGDCLVLNNSRVFSSRLFGRRAGHAGRIEVFLLRPAGADDRTWEVLVRPGRKVSVEEVIEFDSGLRARILTRSGHGLRTVRLECEGPVFEAIERIGHMPLPPYIRRPDTPGDRERYQTVYASSTGSVAAPTAGLHFTEEMLDRCRARGAALAEVTLHVGLGTFQPVHEETLRHQRLHEEFFEVPAEAWEAIHAARRVIGVGTTSVRSIESYAMGRRGSTDLFILPGFEFQVTQAMLTNFHLPSSSLIMLVCAFAGQKLTLAAYHHAVAGRYRFFSYGDCMLLL